MLELLCLDLLGEKRLENQSDRVLESFSCPIVAVEDDELEDNSANPEKPKVLAPTPLPAPLAPYVPAVTPLSTSAGAEDGVRSMWSPFAGKARMSGVECGARMPRLRMILNTCA